MLTDGSEMCAYICNTLLKENIVKTKHKQHERWDNKAKSHSAFQMAAVCQCYSDMHSTPNEAEIKLSVWMLSSAALRCAGFPSGLIYLYLSNAEFP